MKFSLSIFSLSLLAGALASNVLDLDPSNFDIVIGQGKPALVELCANSFLTLHCVVNDMFRFLSFAPWWYVPSHLQRYCF